MVYSWKWPLIDCCLRKTTSCCGHFTFHRMHSPAIVQLLGSSEKLCYILGKSSSCWWESPGGNPEVHSSDENNQPFPACRETGVVLQKSVCSQKKITIKIKKWAKEQLSVFPIQNKSRLEERGGVCRQHDPAGRVMQPPCAGVTTHQVTQGHLPCTHFLVGSNHRLPHANFPLHLILKGSW